MNSNNCHVTIEIVEKINTHGSNTIRVMYLIGIPGN